MWFFEEPWDKNAPPRHRTMIKPCKSYMKYSLGAESHQEFYSKHFQTKKSHFKKPLNYAIFIVKSFSFIVSRQIKKFPIPKDSLLESWRSSNFSSILPKKFVLEKQLFQLFLPRLCIFSRGRRNRSALCAQCKHIMYGGDITDEMTHFCCAPTKKNEQE